MLNAFCIAILIRFPIFVPVKRTLLLFLILISTSTLLSQVRWEEKSYVEFATSRSGIHVLTGAEIQQHGILQYGDRIDRLVVQQRTESVLSHVNDTGATFIEPSDYFINDADGILDANSKVFFYVDRYYSVAYNSSLDRYVYLPHPYSNREHFLVSATAASGSFEMLERQADLPGVATRDLRESRQFWVRDTAMYNLVGTGRQWFGELFDFTTTQNFSLPFSPKQGTTMNVEANAVARSSVSSTSLTIQNGGTIAFPAIGSSSVAAYVTGRTINSNIPASTTVQLTYNKTSDNGAAMWLDRLKVNYITNNEYFADSRYQKRYQSIPRHADSLSNLWVEGSGLLVFDITDKRAPVFINPMNSGGSIYWEMSEDQFRECIAVRPSDAFSPTFVRSGRLTDLEAYENDGVTSLIIAPDSLLNEATRLAVLQNSTGNISRVVALEEIYAMANAGTPDIAAIRQFLVRVKNRYANSLQFLVLFGDASYDYKGTLPGNSNLVPTYESLGSFSLYTSYMTDDYFGYLDHGESTNWFIDNLDLGIGRIPVRNAAQATDMVDKIERYLTSAERFGPWRGDVVLVADDVDHGWEREFAVVQDALARRLDTSRPELNLVKIYSDAYLQESQPGSQRYPTAREELFRRVQQGALAVSFVGHGGEVGWTTERILQLEDINGWSNRTKLPVFTTITCEFTRFDDPNRVSAGEQLFLNPEGGAIALFSTTRSVFATNSTYDLNRLLNQNMMGLETPRLGDVLKITKNNNNSGDKIKFSLIGDPTLPLARPERTVYLDSINNQQWSSFTDTLNALSWVQIKGHIGTSNTVDANFNGTAWLTFYDKAQINTTRRNDQLGNPVNFSKQNNAIYRGKATVNAGRFTVEFRVPLDINLSIGPPKVISYAASNDEDAWGGRNDLLIGGVYDGVITDDQGPEVRLFVNDTTFSDGGISDADPLAIGLLEDESGINAVGLGIGHNIVLELDGTEAVVNDAYQSDVDDFTKGTVTFQYYDIAPGIHTLSLRAWDVLNQWGYDEVEFLVVDEDEPILEQLQAYPNPFTSELHFNLHHNQKGIEGSIRLDIINNQGQTVWTWNDQTTLNANSTDLPVFRISDVPSGAIAPGFYHARVTWKRTLDGKTRRIQEKLIFIR